MVEDPPSSSFSSSKARQLDADAGNQDTFSPDFDNGHDQVPYYPRDHSFPAVYVNPAVVDKYYVARPDDVVFMPATSPHAVGLSDVVSPTSSSIPFGRVVDASDPLNPASHLCSGSWDMNLVKAESPEAFVAFNAIQTHEGADTYLVDGYGLNTYDSLEFQTLREHNAECSHSHPSP
jgi:hypothetical protein